MSEVIPHWLTKQAYLAPDQAAIEFVNGNTITFFELKEQSQRFAKKLATCGVKKGSHVGVLSMNNASMVIAIHALSYLGAVAVMLNTRLTRKELVYQINDAEVSIVLTSDSLGSDVHEMEFPVAEKTFSQIDQQAEATVELLSEINLNDVFTIIYTSGTTGFPKGVIHTYGNHWWSAMGSALNLGLDSDDKWLASLPIFHVGGLSILMKSVIYGMPVYLLEKFNEQIVHDAIIERGVTIVSVVTVMLQRLINILGENKYPEAFRCMLLGGGPAPKPLLEKAKVRNVPVFQTYGMTETSSQIVTLSPKDALEKIGSAGKPLFPAQIKIDNTDEDPVGEIFVKGPMVTSGYFNKKEATKESIHDRWLATGDLGYLDDEGFLYVVDRRKDLIISGGENIYPSEVESVLSGMDKVKEVGVVGKVDETWGEVPVAFIVPEDDMLTAENVIDYANEYLAKYKIPRQIIFVDFLPRNASNKLVRMELVNWLKQNDTTKPTSYNI